MMPLHRLLPRPGPVWGATPQRPAQDTAPPWRGLAGLLRGLCGLRGLQPLAQAARRHAAAAPAPGSAEHAAALATLRARLHREGMPRALLAQALGSAAHAAEHELGVSPRDNQLLAALALLDQRLAEVPTGEGKTLAIALAAAVAALAGVPVHVVTANDYLAARDAARLRPLYAALGLTVAARPGAADDAARRAVYAQDVVYATAKDLAFDHLRDREAGAGRSGFDRAAAALGARASAPPVMRGLCLALLDEADSILLDDAELPLILSRPAPQAARRAFLWQALALARRLEPGRDFTHHAADRVVRLSAAGQETVAAAAAGLSGPWQRPRYAREAVHSALAALHTYRRNEHYVVRDGAVEVLDEVTGRVAPGRVWSRGLHTLLAMKEGLRPPDETETLARTSFQRFFQRYWRLGGTSGTLWEARAELRAVYGLVVCRIAAHRPCRRSTLPSRGFVDPQALFDAAAARAAALAGQGRPVLIGTDSVADSRRLATALRTRGCAHQVLNALNDAEEAAIVAAAGAAGRVTVATRMAGRGTDIEPDAAALAAGGLHVLSCQHNPSRRHDRQLAGRAGRRGEPGSAESWFSVPAPAQAAPAAADTDRRWPQSLLILFRALGARLARRGAQRCEESRRAALRHSLMRQDDEWASRLSFAGPPD